MKIHNAGMVHGEFLARVVRFHHPVRVFRHHALLLSGTLSGDLTTSNVMLRAEEATPAGEGGTSTLEGRVVFIDFGLSQGQGTIEDRAVEL